MEIALVGQWVIFNWSVGGNVAWLFDWFLSLFAATSTIRKLRAANEKLLLSRELAEMERDSFARQLEAATDTIQAFGLHNRAIGMESKIYAAEMIERTKPT